MSSSPSQSPAVSVIVPVYQVRDYIRDCLQSLIDQVNPPPYELLLVDDCGKDDSVELALQFLSSTTNPPPYQLLRHEANRGLSAARNTGIAAAEGDYLFFLDSDDKLAPDALSLLYTAARQHGADVVIGQTSLMTDDPAWMDNQTGILWQREETLKAYIAEQWSEMGCNKLIRSTFMREHGLQFKEGLLHEDNRWSLYLAFSKPSIYCIPERTYVYRNVRPGSIMNSYSMRNIEHLLGTLSEFARLAVEEGIAERPEVQLFYAKRLNAYLKWQFHKVPPNRRSYLSLARALRAAITPPMATMLRLNDN
ncbi:MAG: glycosyltransferase family 2 protein, partial [Bacteroidales bacterium]|nr:glycosyltransferase family 2 protein [Bacteroidales bacterium]